MEQHPLLAVERYKKHPQVKDTRTGASHQQMGEGVLFVTEPHAELNAGFVVLFASDHPAIFDWTRWHPLSDDHMDETHNVRIAEAAKRLNASFWSLMEGYLSRCLRPHEISHDDRRTWIQTGFALSPLLGTCAQFSVDVILTWALIGEWISRVLFPPPVGTWPRQGHPQDILQEYLQRLPASQHGHGRVLSRAHWLRCSIYLVSSLSSRYRVTRCFKARMPTGERNYTWKPCFNYCGIMAGSAWHQQ